MSIMSMDNDTIGILTERAFGALTDASEAAHDANSSALAPVVRAEHARRARELAGYAKTLLRIVRESERVAREQVSR